MSVDSLSTPVVLPQRAISERIDSVRYLMIVGIVLLHVPPYVPVEAVGTGLFEWWLAWVQHGVFRAAVPVLTAISGFLLFRAGLERDFTRLLVKKTRTLLVPLIVFNLPVALAVAVLQWRGGGVHDFSHGLYPPTATGWADALLGLWAIPVNPALHFLRDLYVVSLLAPLLGWLARRHPLAGLLALLAVSWWNLDGWLVLRDSMLVNFYLGALVVVRGWEPRGWDRWRWPLLMAFLVLSVLAVAFQDPLLYWLRLAAPLLVWPAAALLADTRLIRWLAGQSGSSFFIYVCHAPLLFGGWLMYRRVLADALPYWLFWWGSAILVIVSLRWLHRRVSARLPVASRLLLGGR